MYVGIYLEVDIMPTTYYKLYNTDNFTKTDYNVTFKYGYLSAVADLEVNFVGGGEFLLFPPP